MELVVRTQHGDAEVAVGRHGPGTTIDEVVAVVTGRAAPPLVHVDGRPVPSSTRLADGAVGAGSLIELDPPARRPGGDDGGPVPVVELVQVAGPGAGSRAGLVAGVHRVGPGRRVNASELALAPVESVAFELHVATNGTVAVRAGSSAVRIDGRELPALTAPSAAAFAWRGGRLDADGRVFELAPVAGPAARPPAGAGTGTVLLERRPLPSSTAEPGVALPPVSAGVGRLRRRRAIAELQARVDALAAETTAARRGRHLDPSAAAEAALTGSVALWRHRSGDPGSADVCVGLADVAWRPPFADTVPDGVVVRPLPMVPVTVDLAAEHGIGLVGASDRTRPLARWSVIDAAVRRGPADLEVVVLTGPERVPSWEWVKWLPHARVGGRPAVWSSTEDVAAWASAARLGDRPGGGRRAATLVVVDEPAWWRAPTAVLRPLLADVADGSATRELWFVLVARSVEEVPGVCRVVVRTDGDDGTGRAVTVEWPERVASGVVPIAVTADLATTVARRLARFDDPDRPVRPHMAPVDGPLVVQPFIVGRELTPMERRLAQLVEQPGGGRGERPRASEAVPP